MHVEVYRGQVLRGRQGVRNQWREWTRWLALHDRGWAGSLAGIGPEGQFLGVVQFSGPARPVISGNGSGPPRWPWTRGDLLAEEWSRHSSDVERLPKRYGEPGLLRVRCGTVADRRLWETAGGPVAALVRDHRPDVLWGWLVWLSANEYLALNTFTSAAAARAADTAPLPEQHAKHRRAWIDLLKDSPSFDVPEPWVDDRVLTYDGAETLYQRGEQRRRERTRLRKAAAARRAGHDEH